MASIQRSAQITQPVDPEATRLLGKPLTWHLPYLVTRPNRERYARRSRKALSSREAGDAIRFACERQDWPHKRNQ